MKLKLRAVENEAAPLRTPHGDDSPKPCLDHALFSDRLSSGRQPGTSPSKT